MAGASGADPRITRLYHFTHLENLASISQGGLLSDTVTRAQSLLEVEVGEPAIKESRRQRVVPVAPGGVVGDYVPFYFAPRSPMLFSVTRGNVPTFTGDAHDLLYLCTTIEHLQGTDAGLVLTDRNAAKRVAEFSADESRWFADGFIDWDLMRQVMWNDIPEYRDRMERRMAECLVHRHVPWEGILALGAYDDRRAAAAAESLGSLGATPRIYVRPGWYY